MDVNAMQKQEHSQIAVIGNVDSGKTTLVGVLTKGIPDDGRGSARVRVFNYPHEIQNGRTSSIAQQIIGFDEKGQQILPDRFSQNKNKYWKEVNDGASKVVTVIDLCGHERYLKTTMFGLTALVPDYSMIVIGSNMGISKMTKEHLGITVALKIPFFVVLSKIDIAPENVFEETITTLKKILKSPAVNKVSVEIRAGHDEKELKKVADSLASDKICPIFMLSSVSGEGMPELLKFLYYAQNRDSINGALKSEKDPLEFDINEVFTVAGVGICVSGLVKSGTAVLNQPVNLGPDKTQAFKQVTIKSIHVNRSAVDKTYVGEYACFNIKPSKTNEKLSRSDFRKGMVLLDVNIKPDIVSEFEAEIVILHHATTIKQNYQAVMHCGVIRQSCMIQKIHGSTQLKNGDKAISRFRFMMSPEYLKIRLPVLFREGRTKILGLITRILTDEEAEIEDAKDLQERMERRLLEGQPATDAAPEGESENQTVPKEGEPNPPKETEQKQVVNALRLRRNRRTSKQMTLEQPTTYIISQPPPAQSNSSFFSSPLSSFNILHLNHFVNIYLLLC